MIKINIFCSDTRGFADSLSGYRYLMAATGTLTATATLGHIGPTMPTARIAETV